MNKKNWRTIIGVLWLLVAILYFQGGNLVIAACSVIIGILFFIAAWKGPME